MLAADVVVDAGVQPHPAMAAEAAAAHRPLQRQRGDVGLAGAEIDDQMAVRSAQPDTRTHRGGERRIEQVRGPAPASAAASSSDRR